MEGGGTGNRGGRGEGATPPLSKKALVFPGALATILGPVGRFGDALAGRVATTTPVGHIFVFDLVVPGHLAGARVEATADALVLHVAPRDAFYVSLKLLFLLGRLTGRRTSTRSGSVVLTRHGRHAGLFTCVFQELLDVRPTRPVDHVEFEGLKELLGN